MAGRLPSFFRSRTNLTALVGLLVVVTRHFGWAEISDETASSLVDTALFVLGMFLRAGVQKAEEAAKTAAGAALATEVQTQKEGG